MECEVRLGLELEWSCLFIGIDASHVDGAFKSQSLSRRCNTTVANLGDVVEVLDILLSPVVYQLRLSVYLVILPSVQFRGVLAGFQYSSFAAMAF